MLIIIIIIIEACAKPNTKYVILFYWSVSVVREGGREATPSTVLAALETVIKYYVTGRQ